MINGIKAYLMNGICVAEISASSPIFKFYHQGIIDDHHANGESKMICSEGKVNHAVVLVGWGVDEYEQEYFIIKNHFGKDWGEKGYARISTKVSM